MARIIEFSDGAERGDASWWTSGSASATVTNVLHGTYCYQFGGGSSASAQKTITTPMSEFYFKCYVRWPAGVSSFTMAFRNASTALLTMAYNQAQSRIDISTATTGNTGNNSVTAGVWQCLEVYYKIDNAAGEITIKIDGVQVFTFTGDTQPGAATTMDNFALSSGSGETTTYLDDFALDDATWCGLGYYVPMTVSADGTLNEWTPSAGSNYQNVGIPASDSTYNSTNLAKTDEYNLTTVDITGKTVLRVIPWGRVQNSLGGSVNMGLLTYATSYTAVVATPTSFAWKPGDEYTVNPNTTNPWNQTELDALQFHIDTL